MRVKSIKIKNFQSFKDFTWESINPNLNIIVGPNGSGKTNFFNSFRMLSDLLNERNSSELLSEIKGFAHLGKWNKKIELSMSVEFENKEKDIILEFIRASLIGTLSNKGIQFELVDDEKLFGFLTVDDIKDFFKGDLIAEYDFYSGRWNVRYESETVQCLVEGDYAGHILATDDGKGLMVDLREKFTKFIKSNFDETKIKHVNLEQISTNIQRDGKLREALSLTIQSNHYPVKSMTIFRNLISDTNTSRGYSLGNLFGWLLRNAFVFTDNIREMPKTIYSSKEIEEEQKNDSINSRNIAFVLHGLKNGNLEDREKFYRIKENFKELTEGLEFDITAKYISSPIQTGRQFDFNENPLVSANQENVHEDKRDISISLYLQVIKDGHEFPLRYSGAGTWEALYFSCLMESKGNIFLLDEPVANVHPNRQKLFSGKFQKNTNGQLFISTHSPYLTGLEDVEKISRFDFDVDEKTTVRHFCPEPIDTKTQEILNRTKAAISSLFAKAVILVEGETESAAIPKWFNEFFGSSLEDKNIILISTGSKSSFIHYLRLLEGFNIPWAVLCDGDAIGTAPNSCEIGSQLTRIGMKFDNELTTMSYQDRKAILSNRGIFTTAGIESETFESMRVFHTVNGNGKSKPERGYEVSSNNPCPNELKEQFFERLKTLKGWSDFKLD